ncbi:hypothetical protein RN001_010631 [Aquatica leii]|uniref:NADH-ubiquinone oxidoreductase MWFE subunit n=1 Tax=Aquatica leii TaxID=1421715 RepID=A0AAN7P197_9COLE|nr:hypothetical protein RN001_010631 [Aquatica leii]
MWYEIIPTAAIIYVALSFPHYSAYVINKVVVGNMFRRSLYEKKERLSYLRDTRLSGNPYKVVSLEQIPDE